MHRKLLDEPGGVNTDRKANLAGHRPEVWEPDLHSHGVTEQLLALQLNRYIRSERSNLLFDLQKVGQIMRKSHFAGD